MTSKTLELIAKGKDEASGVLGGVGGAVSGLGSIAAGVATGGLALAGAAIVGIGTAAVLVGKQIFDFSQESETAMGRLQAQTGSSALEMIAFTEAAKGIYAAGVGESISDVADQMSLVHLATGLTGEELEAATIKAVRLGQVFEWDVAESMSVVSSMTKSWGINSDEAFDILVKGSQMGLDIQNDLLDTMHEYSGDFKRLGFTAAETLALLNAGLEEGAYNTDVIADGWREYNIRLLEGGDDISELFTTMGLDFDAITASVAAGDETWGDYASTVVEGLMGIDDQVLRNAAGVAIFGTKWEDLGGDIFLASGQAMEGIEGIGGASDDAADVMATGLGPALERLKRTFITEFAPLGDMAGEVINEYVIPFLKDAALWLGEKVPLAMAALKKYWDEHLEDVFIAIGEDLETFTITLLPGATSAWGNLEEAWRETASAWDEDLGPALDRLIGAMGIGTGETGSFVAILGAALGVFLDFKTQGLVDDLKDSMEFLTAVVNDARRAIDLVGGALDSVAGFLEDVWYWINRNNEAWEGMDLPWWLQPGSPSPLENALVGIGEAFSELPPEMSIMMGDGGGGGGGMSSVVIHNHFGSGSVRSDEDILDIADAITVAFERRGVRVPL